MKKWIGVCFLAVVMCAIINGQSNASERIAVIRNLSNDDHTKQFLSGCVAVGKTNGYQVDVFVSNGNDVKMQELILKAIKNKYIGLVISHGKESYSAKLIQQAVDNGIQVVTFDTPVQIQGVTSTAQDDDALARLSLDALLKSNGGNPVRLLKVWFDATLTPFAKRNAIYEEYEKKGLIKTIAEIYPAQVTTLQADTAEATKKLLNRYTSKEIDGIWVAWDELAKGVYAGLAAKGVADIPLVSIDISNEDIERMKKQPMVWIASAAVDAKMIGKMNMQFLLKKLQGKQTPATYYFPAMLVKSSLLGPDTTMDNLDKVVPEWGHIQH